MIRVLTNVKIEMIQLPSEGVSLIALPNDYLVYGTFKQVYLLNENFQELISVSTGGFNYCALNHRNEIYVSDQSKHCIILFDLNLNKLRHFGSEGEYGNNKLNYPRGLCCHGDFLYICDYLNSRIQILTLDFEYVNTIQLDGGPYKDYRRPFKVQISNTTIGVSCDHATIL